MIFLNFIYFFFLLIFTFYIPGYLFLKLVKFNNKDLLTTAVLSVGVGIVSFMLFSYILSWVHLEFYYNVFLIFCIPTYIKLTAGRLRFKFKNIFKAEYLIILIGSIFTSYLMWRSGSVENNNLVFYAVNSTDAIYHLSLIGNLIFNFPPTHPGLFEFPLKGYNFFYDLAIAYFSKFYRLDVLDLFFRFFPVFLSIFYGMSGLVLAKFMGMKKESILVFITLLYFAQSFLSIIPSLNSTYDPGIVQTIANIVDPSVILSISLLFNFYVLVFSARTKYLFIVSALFLGVIPMIKIYTGLLVFLSLGIIFVIRLFRKKDFYYFPVLLLGGFIFTISYFPINFGSGGLIFAPNLLYRHYLESISMANNLTWYQKLLVFEEYDNYIKIILYKFILVLPLFYLPSLGLRIINLFHFKKIFNRNLYSESNLFWGFIIIFSFIIPSFFIQSTAVFVVLQFLWIGYFVLLIPTAYSLPRVFGKSSTVKTGIIIGIIVLLSLPDNIKLFNLYSSNPYKIDLNLYEISKVISKIPEEDGVIVLNVSKSGETYSALYNVPIISALSSRSVYFEPEHMEFRGIESEVNYRKSLVGDFGNMLNECPDSLSSTNEIEVKLKQIKSPYILDLKNTPCFDKLENIELIYKKSDYTLYKII